MELQVKKSSHQYGLGYYIATFVLNLIPLIVSVTCVIPIAWLIMTTFKTSAQFEANVAALPTSLNLANYISVFSSTNIPLCMYNTARNTFIALILVILAGFINGYFFSRVRFKGKGLMLGVYFCSLFIPVHALLVPMYILMAKVKMINHWYTTIFPMLAGEMTLAMYLVMGYLREVPRELEEAAAIDGSSFSRTMFTIIMPIARPILVTVGIVAFFHFWNEFTYSLVLISDNSLYTINLAISCFKGETNINYTEIMTAMTIAILPALSIYVFFSKYIIRGMIAGAVKG